MRKVLFGAWCIMLICVGTTGFAQDIKYVATEADGGDDSNSGEIDAPYATVAKALAELGAGGTCYLRAGTYREEVAINSKNGSDGSPIVIKPYEEEEVVFDGTVPLDLTWTQHSGNIYKAALDIDIWQLFAGGEQRVPARWPNAQFSDNSVFDQDYWAGGDEGTDTEGNMHTDPSEGHSLAALNKSVEGGMVIANVGSFKTWAGNVLTHTAGSEFFTYDGITGVFKTAHHKYFLEGDFDLIDTDNEWFYDYEEDMLYMWQNEGEDLNDLEIKGKVQSFAFNFSNSSYINIEGIKFFATTFYIGNSTHITVENCSFAFPNCTRRMLGETGVPKVTEIKQNQATGTSNCTIRKCLFEHTDGEALRLNGDGNVVENNYFHHIDWSCGSIDRLQTSINCTGVKNIFTKNTFHTAGASETFYCGNEATITYNDISKGGLLQNDGAAIHATRNGVTGTEIAYNWIHDSPKYGVRFDAPAGDAGAAGTEGLVHHNVVWNITASGGMMIKGDHQKIYNNTVFANKINDIIMLDEADGNLNSLTHNNAANKISGNRTQSSDTYPTPGTVSHNWNGYDESGTLESMLTDVQNRNFAPKAGSALINAGMEIAGITDNFEGAAPDIGAYESGDTWKAGIDWTPDFYPWATGTEVEDPAITSEAIISGVVGAKYAYQIKSNVDGTWTINSDPSATWLTIDPTTGLLAGTPTESGSYSITVKLTTSIKTVEQQFTLTVAGDGNVLNVELPAESQISVYPNPASAGRIRFIGLQSTARMIIYDHAGNQLVKNRVTGEEVIDLNEFGSGLYLVRLIHNNKYVTLKVIVSD